MFAEKASPIYFIFVTTYTMRTMADVYKGRYKGTIENIPEVSQKMLDRKAEIKAILKEDKTAILNDSYTKELHAIAFLRGANIMKGSLDDGIDIENQTTKAVQCMDIYTGLLEELGTNDEEYRLA